MVSQSQSKKEGFKSEICSKGNKNTSKGQWLGNDDMGTWGQKTASLASLF